MKIKGEIVQIITRKKIKNMMLPQALIGLNKNIVGVQSLESMQGNFFNRIVWRISNHKKDCSYKYKIKS